MEYKNCSNPNCQQVNPQPLANFHPDKRAKDGKQSRCKFCKNAYAIQSQKTEQGKAKLKVRRDRYQTSEKGYITRLQQSRSAKSKETLQKYRTSERGRAISLRVTRESRKKYPEQYKARNAVNNAVRDGKLPRASTYICQCGARAKEYHHHHGYDSEHRLDVIPLCTKCHGVSRLKDRFQKK